MMSVLTQWKCYLSKDGVRTPGFGPLWSQCLIKHLPSENGGSTGKKWGKFKKLEKVGLFLPKWNRKSLSLIFFVENWNVSQKKSQWKQNLCFSLKYSWKSSPVSSRSDDYYTWCQRTKHLGPDPHVVSSVVALQKSMALPWFTPSEGLESHSFTSEVSWPESVLSYNKI